MIKVLDYYYPSCKCMNHYYRIPKTLRIFCQFEFRGLFRLLDVDDN